ncbi:MAG: prepilin-type N-terminal cleavage/methylation domain-containing protein [Kiritimatiellia bacterium]
MPPSRSGFHSPLRAGFTLKELLAVLVALGLLVALSYPSITAAMHDQQANPLLQQGSQLAKELLAKRLAGMPVEEVYPMTPQSGGENGYASSTLFFHHLIQDGVLQHDYSIFGGKAARPVKTKEARRFAPDNNVWNVVVDAPTVKSSPNSSFHLAQPAAAGQPAPGWDSR